MKNYLVLVCLLLGLGGKTLVHGAFINAWINELHYDNQGSDSGEFIEVVVPSSITDLNNLTVTFYNGSDGKPYDTAGVGGSSHALSTFTLGSSANGFTVYHKAVSGMQNDTDGLALSYGSTVLQFLSYEGSFVGVGGFADGITSVNIGIQEYNAGSLSTPAGYSIGLTGTGSQYSQFTWTTFSDDSPGSINMGQTLVPEPTQVAMGIFGAMISVGGIVRWQKKRSVANR